VGNRTIIKRAISRIKAGEPSQALRLAGGKLNRITPEILSHAARKGDRLSRAIWNEVGHYLGIGLAGIVNVYNPHRIVIGGGVAEAGEVLFRPTRSSLKRHAFSFPMKHLKVVKAKLGNDAGVVGASVLVRRSFR